MCFKVLPTGTGYSLRSSAASQAANADSQWLSAHCQLSVKNASPSAAGIRRHLPHPSHMTQLVREGRTAAPPSMFVEDNEEDEEEEDDDEEDENAEHTDEEEDDEDDKVGEDDEDDEDIEQGV